MCHAAEGDLTSLERQLEIARGQGLDTQLLDELDQIVNEIRAALRPNLLAEQKLRTE